MPAAAAEAAAAVRLQLPAVAAGQPLQLVVAIERMAAVVEHRLPVAAVVRKLAAVRNTQAAAAGRRQVAAAQPDQHSGLNQTPKPVVLPNDFAKSSGNTIEMYIWANGKNISTTCHSGRPTICIITTMLYIGTNDAQPGLPALVKIRHMAIIISMETAITIKMTNSQITTATAPTSLLAA